MFDALIITAIYWIEAAFDYPALKKLKSKKTFAVYAIIFLIAYVVMVLRSFNLDIPSPVVFFTGVVQSLTGQQ